MSEHADRENTPRMPTLKDALEVEFQANRLAAREKGFVVEVPGLPPVRFLGWRSTHGTVRVAALPKPVNRALIEARATVAGSLRSAAAVLRPGDTFDRETGKKIALARLVEALVPLPARFVMAETIPTFEGMRRERERVKSARSRLFLEIWRRTHKGELPARARKSNYPFYYTPPVYCVPKGLNWFHRNFSSMPGPTGTEVKGIATPTARPTGPIQGQTASTVIFDEISKWPSPEAPDMKKPPSPEEAKS